MYQLGGLESFPSLFLLLASSKTTVSPSTHHHSSRTLPVVFHCSRPGVTKDQTKLHENNNCFRVSMHVFFNTFQLLKSVQKENISKYLTRNFVSIAVKCRYRKSNIFKQCFLVRILQRR